MTSTWNMERLQAAFQIADTDGDGILSWDEVDNLFSIVKFTPSDNSKNEIRRKISNPSRGDLVDKIVFQVRSLILFIVLLLHI